MLLTCRTVIFGVGRWRKGEQEDYGRRQRQQTEHRAAHLAYSTLRTAPNRARAAAQNSAINHRSSRSNTCTQRPSVNGFIKLLAFRAAICGTQSTRRGVANGKKSHGNVYNKSLARHTEPARSAAREHSNAEQFKTVQTVQTVQKHTRTESAC